MYLVEGVRSPYGPRERGHTGEPEFGVDSRAEPSPWGRAGSGRLSGWNLATEINALHTIAFLSHPRRPVFFLLHFLVLLQLLRKGNGRGADFAQRTASLPVIPPIYTP